MSKNEVIPKRNYLEAYGYECGAVTMAVVVVVEFFHLGRLRRRRTAAIVVVVDVVDVSFATLIWLQRGGDADKMIDRSRSSGASVRRTSIARWDMWMATVNFRIVAFHEYCYC
ncbi:unnamed protein product [Symbiodinium sp. KB8]|nr:unnamed protein product [Symbiodinium sp. KB8]